MQVTFKQWVDAVEICISRTVGACSPRAWNEDHISYSWIAGITKRFQDVQIRDLDAHYSVAWDAYKAEGRLEEEQGGDIALIVKMSFGPGQNSVGVAFLEAKRIYSDRSYAALKWPQLESQATRVANHRVLLYDHQPITEFRPNLLGQGYYQASSSGSFDKVRCAVVPTQHLLAVKSRGADIHSLSLPLSYQLCVRYLRGFDLDYSRDIVDAVGGGAADGIRYLLVAHVSHAAEVAVAPSQINVNRNVFTKFEHGEGRAMAAAASG